MQIICGQYIFNFFMPFFLWSQSKFFLYPTQSQLNERLFTNDRGECKLRKSFRRFLLELCMTDSFCQELKKSIVDKQKTTVRANRIIICQLFHDKESFRLGP